MKAKFTDKQILTWLLTKHVEVREPLVYGSLGLFHASPADSDGDTAPSDLREQCIAAMEKEPK